MNLDPETDFWNLLDDLTTACELIIDRPKGSAHPRYASLIYPLDYGYLRGTASADGSGIDIWRGSSVNQTVCAVMVIVDSIKRDSEIKLLYACTPGEIEVVQEFHNTGSMRGLLFKRS